MTSIFTVVHRFGHVCITAILVFAVLVGTGGLAAAQSAPTPSAPSAPSEPPPLPLLPVDECSPNSPLPACHFAPVPAPCAGYDCAAPPPAPPGPSPPPIPVEELPGEGIAGLLNDLISGFFASVVRSALNPLLDLLGDSLLATPTLVEMPTLGEIWTGSQQILFAIYGLLILVAGIVVMAYHTLQTRTSIKEILPRVSVGFVAANMSLFLGGQAMDLANALSQAVLGEGINPDTAAQALTDTLTNDLDGGALFIIIMGLALVVMIVLVLLTYVVRVMLTVILLAGAPLLLMCHALPQTERIAFWWWKSFAGVLAIQVGQSLTMVTALKLFFMPGGITLF